MKVSIALEAENELVEGTQFYARQADAALGLAFIAEFERSIDLLRAHPKIGTPWRGNTRRMPLRRFPYSILYQLLPSELRVLAVAHQRRKPGYWIGRG